MGDRQILKNWRLAGVEASLLLVPVTRELLGGQNTSPEYQKRDKNRTCFLLELFLTFC